LLIVGLPVGGERDCAVPDEKGLINHLPSEEKASEMDDRVFAKKDDNALSSDS